MSIIKKNMVIILLIVLMSMTGCNSNDNIDTAIANPPTETIVTNPSIEETINEEISKETETTIKEEKTTIKEEKTTIKEDETTVKEDETTEIQTESSTNIKEVEMEPITEPSNTEVYSNSTEKKRPTDSYTSPDVVSSTESNKSIDWSFKRNKDHSKVIGYNQGVDLDKFDAYYIGDTSKKIIYLTFDEGYEYGYTTSILDTLKENNVKATFFLTKSFIESEPELSKRMAQEGHIIGNHSVTHPNMPDKTDEEIKYELEETARYYKEITGYEMDRFFRPPAGKFSARTLDISKQVGYKTIFWSLAYGDWDVKNQPGKEAAYKHIMDNYHDGGIFLLHAVSQSNTEALDDILKGLKEKGYTFASLYDLS